MTTRAASNPLNPLAQPAVAQLFACAAHWSPERWHRAVTTARAVEHRTPRAVSRLLCDALLASDAAACVHWGVHDLARTTVQIARVPRRLADDGLALLEDAALALLARPALSLGDLAVLMQPCLPLIETSDPYG